MTGVTSLLRAALLAFPAIAGVASIPATALADPELFFPWDYNENPWQLTQNPHSWGSRGLLSGLDFDRDGMPRRVLSMFDGVVTTVDYETTYCSHLGKNVDNSVVKVRASDGSGWELGYYHLSSFSVLEGTPVSTGDLLGYSGNICNRHSLPSRIASANFLKSF